MIAGPALGGIIFAIEPVAVYATAAGLLTASLVAVLAMRPVVRSFVTTEPPGWDSLVAGVRFILRTRMLLGAISLDLFAVLLGDSIALAPVFARSILHIGPVGLGLLRTAPSVGALVAARDARAQAAAHAGRADDDRDHRDLRRRDDRLRPLEVAAALARRARGHRLRRHGQREHPPDGGHAPDAARSCRDA